MGVNIQISKKIDISIQNLYKNSMETIIRDCYMEKQKFL